MAQDTINRIKEAEMDSISLRRQATDTAEKTISEAKLEAQKIISDSVASATAQADKLIKDAKTEAQAYINGSAEESQKSAKSSYDTAINKQQQVNELVKSLIV